MRFGSISGLRCKQLKVVILTFFVVFLLWKWEKGTYFNAEVLQPDSLVLTHPGHLENTELSLIYFGNPSISILIFTVSAAANSKFVDQHTSSEEDFPSAEPFPQSVVKVEKQVTGAPPPLSIIGYSVDDADDNEVSPSEKKGNYLQYIAKNHFFCENACIPVLFIGLLPLTFFVYNGFFRSNST